MKLAAALKFSTLTAIFSSIIGFYAPVSLTLMLVFSIITIRFIIDLSIVKKSRKSRGTKCRLYLDAGKEFFWFLIVYLAIIAFIYPTDIHLLSFFGSENFIVTRGAAVIIIVYEVIIINLRFKVLTGETLGSRIMKVVKLAKEVKIIKDDFKKQDPE
jgi:hypothetical protein